MVRCGICAQTYSRTWSWSFRNPHLDTVHPEYSKWLRRWTITFLIVPTPLVWVLLFVELQAIETANVPLLSISSTLYFILIQFWAVSWLIKLRRVKRQWKAELP